MRNDVTYHVMTVEIDKALGKVIFTCPTCDRCVETRGAGGGVKIIRRGDQTARHSGWAMPPGTSAEAIAEIDTGDHVEIRSIQ
jgi:hypothetical protein